MLPLVKLVAALCLLFGSFTASWMTFQQFWKDKGVEQIEIIETPLNNMPGFSYEFRHNGRPGTYKEALNMLSEGNMDFLIPLNHAITSHYTSVYWECAPVKLNSVNKQPFRFVVLPAVALDGREADTEVFADKFTLQRKTNEKDPFTSFLNLGKDSLFVVPLPEASAETEIYQRDEVLSPLINDHAKKVAKPTSSDIASFIRISSPALVTQLWARVGQEMLRALESTRNPHANALLERISSEFLAGCSFTKTPKTEGKEGNLRRVAAAVSEKFKSAAEPTALPFKQGSSIWMSTAGVSTAWLHVRLDSRPKYYHYGPFLKSKQ